MLDTPGLSETALSLFRRHVEREGHVAVDDSTREPYRELVRAGLMLAGHSFTGGRESFYVLTEVGEKFARILDRGELTSPSHSESASPHP